MSKKKKIYKFLREYKIGELSGQDLLLLYGAPRAGLALGQVSSYIDIDAVVFAFLIPSIHCYCAAAVCRFLKQPAGPGRLRQCQWDVEAHVRDRDGSMT